MNRDVGILLGIQTALLVLLKLYVGDIGTASIADKSAVGLLTIIILIVIIKLLLTLKPVRPGGLLNRKSTGLMPKTDNDVFFLIWPMNKKRVQTTEEFKAKVLEESPDDFADELSSTLKQLHNLINRKYVQWNGAVRICRWQIALLSVYVIYSYVIELV